MSASRWTPNAINLRYPDQAMLALGTGEYVLAADYERDVAAAEERGFNDGIGEGWNAALEALPHDRACIVNGRAGAKCNCVRGRAIAAIRKDTGREMGGQP